MYKLDAAAFAKAMASIVGMGVIIDRADAKETSEKLSQENKKAALQILSDLKEACEVLGAGVTLIEVERTLALVEADDITLEGLGHAYEIIFGRIRDEISASEVWAVDREKARYLGTTVELFGQEATTRFATEDMVDAGRCLAFGCGTAAVFHLMRVMEVGLKALSSELGIPYAPSWESYLKKIASKMDENHKRKTTKWKRDEPFFRDVSGDLQTVKQAWRNPTMHIVRSYTPDEAEDIFRAVRNFMRRLAEKLDAKP